ncbi:MAG: nucleotidyltransferase domain-containing protein [Candidatus Methanoperedens sp.]|nr:nucleotidyltransferase domain-containing protein [Candidatus Methanoperedens sp.]
MGENYFGLKAGDIYIIIDILRKYPQIEQALIFGSRAKGNYRPGSDVDIVLKGNVNDITTEISFSLNEDSLLPYKFDVLDYNSISNKNLIDHIKRVGIVFYERQK